MDARSHHAEQTVSYHSNPFELIMPGIEGLKVNWLQFITSIFLLLTTVLLGVAAAGFVGVAVNQSQSQILAVGEAVLVGVVIILGAIMFFAPAFYRINLATARAKPITLREAFNNNWIIGVRLVLAQLTVAILVVAGLILLVVPGVIFIAWFSLVPYVVVNEGLSGLAALRRSRELVRGRMWDTYGTISIAAGANILSLIPVFGAYLSIAASLLVIPVLAIRYLELKELKSHDNIPNIPVSPWNFAAIAIALAATGINKSGQMPGVHPNILKP